VLTFKGRNFCDRKLKTATGKLHIETLKIYYASTIALSTLFATFPALRLRIIKQHARHSIHRARVRWRGAVQAADKLKIFHPTTLLN
jgi:hypothetical protein